LLVRVKACGVNPVDAKGVIGDKLPPFMRGFARRLVDGKIAGFDLSGRRRARAPGGAASRSGDEVYGAVPPFRGALAELVSVPLDQVAAKPQSLTHEEAAALVLPGVTVAQLLDQHGFAAGQHVLVLGASGGVGHLAVQVLRARGAGFVAGVCSAKNAAFCESVGAHAVAAYDADDAGKKIIIKKSTPPTTRWSLLCDRWWKKTSVRSTWSSTPSPRTTRETRRARTSDACAARKAC